MLRPLLAFAAMLSLGVSAVCTDETPPIPIPDGYVAQKLDVTDGWIARPKDWFYTNKGVPHGWLWTIAKEDPAKGPYQTGMHIQMFFGLQEAHLAPEKMAQGFLKEQREKNKVLSDCPVAQAGTFMRQCLEVLEDDPNAGTAAKYHIQYSAFWVPDGDMVVITTFGAPEDKWASVKSIQQVMSNVVLIGADFGKKKE
jgi:hypothetical protein